MSKKVLIMCTGNSCRSIIAEALINHYLSNIDAYSCGILASGEVNPNAKRILQENKIWLNSYYSKNINDIIDIEFDLIITVCDHAEKNCPVFPKDIPKVHIGFDDPARLEYIFFEKTYRDIRDILLPKVQEILS